MANDIHLIIALGSQGDVQPYLAVGHALASRGVRVALATHDCFAAMVEGAGLEFRHVAGDPHQIIAGEAGQAWIASGENPLGAYRALRRVVASVIGQAWADCFAAAQDARIIVASRLAAAPALVMAQKLGAPCMPAYLQPTAPTSEFPAVYSSTSLNFSRAYNYLSHVVVEQLYWLICRRAMAGMPGDARFPTPRALVPAAMINGPSLLGVSRAVVPQSAYAKAQALVTGYWFGKAAPEWRPPAGLEAFLAAGEPPVCVTFGSMMGARSPLVGRMAVDAARRLGRKVVLLSGWGGLGEPPDGEDVFVIDQAPHAWLFPRVAAIIHHGGAGTTAAALSAGKPSVITPFFADQAFWGRRLHALGAGPPPAPQAVVRQADLVRHLSAALDGAGFGGALTRLRDRIASEDGPAEAAEAIIAMADSLQPTVASGGKRRAFERHGLGQVPAP